MKIATIIAEETAAQRETERAKYGEPSNTSEPWISGGLLGGEFSYADSLRWDLLLTFGGCSHRCAARANIDEVDLIGVAIEHCRPPDPWLLFWYQAALRAISISANSEVQTALIADALSQIQSKQQRIKEGARVGGMKSAQTRRKIQSTPPGPVLLAERDRLVEGGMGARDVTAVLARKYNVTPAAIRAAYKRN